MLSIAEIVSPFVNFVGVLPENSKVSILGHSDADGLASTVLLAKVLRRLGFSVSSDITRKGESAWSESVLSRISQPTPRGLIAVDLGSRSEHLLPNTPTVLIDHHKPTGVPDNASLITGYELEPVPTSSLLSFWCAQQLQAATDLDWLAAIGLLGDLGDKNPFPEWQHASKHYGKTILRNLTTLVNAPRRAASGDGFTALQILLDADSPRSAMDDPRVAELESARQEYNEALAQGRRAAPRFHGEMALVLVDSPCQIHPAIAQTWAGRLRKNIVLCANTGFLPGRVNFAMRTNLQRNLLELLAAHRPKGAGEEYGRGHDRATGGSLTFEVWTEFVTSLGFALM